MLQPIRLAQDSALVAEGMCPYCGNLFQPDDLVVQCPSCRTPHHLECWRACGNHCTTLRCDGKGETALDMDALSPDDLIQILDSELPQESLVKPAPSHEQLAILASDLATSTALERITSEELPLELSKVNTLARRTKVLRSVILLSVGLVLALAAAGIFLQIRVKPLPIEPRSLAWTSIYLVLGFVGGAVLGAIIGHTNARAHN